MILDKNYEVYLSRKPETAVARRSRNQQINPPYLIILCEQNFFLCTLNFNYTYVKIYLKVCKAQLLFSLSKNLRKKGSLGPHKAGHPLNPFANNIV